MSYQIAKRILTPFRTPLLSGANTPGSIPPPFDDAMITEDGETMITEDGEIMITEQT